jgi:hypothetical protein
MPARKAAKKKPAATPVPATDWRTTDQDEILRSVQRARDEKHSIANLRPERPVFSTFAVKSPSGMTYQVEIRDLKERSFSCTCPDFRTAGLGTCKHVEATLIWLKRRLKGEYRLAEKSGSPLVDIVPAGSTLRIERNLTSAPPAIRMLFDSGGHLAPTEDLEQAVETICRSRSSKIRLSQDVEPFLENRRRVLERIQLRRDYETGVVSGRHPEHVTLHPLYPYQREGMLHLAFGERALLADEMGLGKTIQAVAACALLHHLGKAQRVLVVTPASLKTEWEEQIKKFTTLGHQLVFGPRSARLKYYADSNPPLFTIVNYEQVVSDSLDLNEHLRPHIVVLDEAQRIKNWATKTAQAVKRLKSRYAFVLTGTPIENRIDELYSIVDFLDPSLLGPLFRFNREFYHFDEKGSPRYHEIQRTFNRIIKDVLGRTALLYLDQNGEGNIDPHAEFSDAETDPHTEEDRGTSFRQLLCIAFDLAVLISYAKEPFFHFVYHDGGLERLQNKLKLALLRIIRETCRTHGIQYIFSALSEDLPIQEDTEGLCPGPQEIILTLDDSGTQGRLFRMGRF